MAPMYCPVDMVSTYYSDASAIDLKGSNNVWRSFEYYFVLNARFLCSYCYLKIAVFQNILFDSNENAWFTFLGYIS